MNSGLPVRHGVAAILARALDSGGIGVELNIDHVIVLGYGFA